MKIIFAGTPEFAATALAAICSAGHQVVLVLSQPDRPAGRGLKLNTSPVAKLAAANQIRVEKLSSLKTNEALELVRQVHADIMVVAAYGLLLPRSILEIPRYGCINIHGSLLPRWRGAAPVQRAIEAGDTITGIDIMQMETGLDTGPILLEHTVAITPEETSGTLFAKLGKLGALSIVEALERISELRPVLQSDVGATYAKKIEKTEAICEKPANVPPGILFEISHDSFAISCGEQGLRILTLQRPGGRRIAAAEFMRSCSISTGQKCK